MAGVMPAQSPAQSSKTYLFLTYFEDAYPNFTLIFKHVLFIRSFAKIKIFTLFFMPFLFFSDEFQGRASIVKHLTLCLAKRIRKVTGSLITQYHFPAQKQPVFGTKMVQNLFVNHRFSDKGRTIALRLRSHDAGTF